ncbi:HAD-IB family phosphatase [Patescibacteria group bacterium]|nr:HAD-IB family phosphatase [Patescibacteria group bacterium]MCG2700412.1 HAD-IB family phosphatase [Candidatus Parcubacteria bacterium]
MQNKLEPLYRNIVNLIKKTKAPAFAVFDFDNTCIINDIAEATLAYLATNNLFRDGKLLKDKFENYPKAVFENYYKLLDDEKIKEAYKFISKILSGFSVGEINSLVDEVIKFEGEDIKKVELFGRKINKGIKPREQIAELVNFLKNNGVAIWIVSASPEILVRQAMKHFNIKANLIGVRNTIIDGKITAEPENPLPMFEGKVECIKKFIDKEKRPLLGVGDSINDLPMMEHCEIKAVIDRQNSLTEKAKQNGWFLI